jgi:excinuclease ABC subunit A
VIKTADWIVDLGPEGGTGGGRVIAQGPPELVAAVEGSHTGVFLREVLADRVPPSVAPQPTGGGRRLAGAATAPAG